MKTTTHVGGYVRQMELFAVAVSFSIIVLAASLLFAFEAHLV